MPNRHVASFAAVSGIVLAGICGCGSPSAANIELRKKNQALQQQVDQLTNEKKLGAQALTASQRGHPTTQTLQPESLAQLVTTHGLKFDTTTGGDNPDPNASVDTQLKVYVVPIDAEGVPIKAAGSFTVQAFDLADSTHPQVGSWKFSSEQVSKLFFHQLLLYTYVLTCPVSHQPMHPDLTVRVTFDDLLTGRNFSAQTQAKMRIAAVK